MTTRIDSFLSKQQIRYGYQGYEKQVILLIGKTGDNAEITITVDADWEEDELLAFGEALCEWAEGLASGKEALLEHGPKITVRLQENRGFYLVGGGEEQAAPKILK